MSRNGNDVFSIGHHDVLALPDYTESSLLHRSNGAKVRNASDRQILSLNDYFPLLALLG